MSKNRGERGSNPDTLCRQHVRRPWGCFSHKNRFLLREGRKPLLAWTIPEVLSGAAATLLHGRGSRQSRLYGLRSGYARLVREYAGPFQRPAVSPFWRNRVWRIELSSGIFATALLTAGVDGIRFRRISAKLIGAAVAGKLAPTSTSLTFSPLPPVLRVVWPIRISPSEECIEFIVNRTLRRSHSGIH